MSNELTETKLPHPNAYNIFVKWFTMPPNERDPRTQPELIAHLHITEKDLAEFQDRDNFYEDIYREAKNWGKLKIPELLHTLYKEFMQSKKPAILETYKKLLEVDKKEGGANITFNVLNPTDEQYRQIIARETRYIENSSQEPSSQFLPTN